MSLADKAKLLLIPSGYKAGKVYSVFPTDGDGDFTFSRTGEATRINQGGLIETVATQVPRIDYYGGGCPSLLLEPQRTNLITKSNALDDNSVFVGFNLGGNAASTQDEIGVDGQISAWTFEKISAFGNTYINIPTNNEHTFSFFVKKQENIGIRVLENVGNNTVFINLETGLTFFGGLASTTIVEDFNSEWWRISVTHTATNSRYYIYLNDGVNLGSTTGTVIIQNFQIEEGSYSTSYIPTNGSIATRSLDKCISGGNNSLFNVNELSLFIDVTNFSDTNFSYITLTDGQSSPINMIRLVYTEDQIQIRGFDDGPRVLNYNITSVVPNQKNKVLLTFDNSQAKIYFNGVFLTTEPTVTIPLGLNSLTFTNRTENGSFFKGKVHDVRFYDTVLTEAEAIELTTL